MVQASQPADWLVIQAEAHGVTGYRNNGKAPYLPRKLSTVAPGGWTCLIRPPAIVEPARTLQFARLQVGDQYGFFDIMAIGIDKVTPNWFHVPFRRPGTWICSALAAESLRFGGWLHDWDDIYDVDPAELMEALIASGGKEITLQEAQPGDVGFGHSKGFVGAAIRFVQHIHHESDWEVNHAFLLDRHLTSGG